MVCPHILQVGCGRWGKNIFRDLLSLKCRVTVVDPDPSACKHAIEHGAFKTFSSVETVENYPIYDGVVVAVPTSLHYQVVMYVLDRIPVIPIFCEKPLSHNLNEAQQMAARALDTLFVMDKWRYHSGIIEMAKLVQNRELGEVLGIRTSRNNWGCPHNDVDSVWILMCHEISIVLELLGNIPEPVSASADVQNGWFHGMVATLGRKPWAVLEVSSRYPETVRETRVLFEHGVAVLEDSYAESLKIARSPSGPFKTPPVIEERPIPASMPLFDELRAFVGFVEGNPPPKSSALDGSRIVETVSKLRELSLYGV